MSLENGIGRHLQFHHYNYGYPGEQPEGIRRRIRQGVGGPKYLEVDAEVQGHLHAPRVNRPGPGNVYKMGFQGEEWYVELTHVDDGIQRQVLATERPHHMIDQEDLFEWGFEVQGVCLARVPKKEKNVLPLSRFL